MDRLIGSIQNYAWGDRSVLAELQGRPPSATPEAELWLGAHAVAPSMLLDAGCTLAEAIDEDPEAVLGPRVRERFGRFPYLLKVLAAAEPLSIQVHPSLAQAKVGFAREAAAGVGWSSRRRTYRDDNHKPELLCALTRFEAKCGFRPLDRTGLIIEALDNSSASRGLAQLRRELATGSDPAQCLLGALEWLFRLPVAATSALVGEVVDAAKAVLADRARPDDLAGYDRELFWLSELDRFHPGDVGVLVALLLNHVVLEPGQAMFLRAGNLHSYLNGAGVELMASSDNVIRGGLTTKHIDVDQLLQVVDTAPDDAPVQSPAGNCHRFEAPVPDFSLTRLGPDVTTEVTPVGPEIVLVTNGTAEVRPLEGAEPATIGRGESALIAWGDGPYRLSTDADALVWRATVGDLSPS